MARDTQATVLYLRLPARALAGAEQSFAKLPLPFAWSVRGRLEQSGHALLSDLAPSLARAQRVVLLLAASDVPLIRVPVPPLPASRLAAALPALVEDRVIGDPADCAIAAGPDLDGQRVIAVADRHWLQDWAQWLRQYGARRIAALPMQLCLPLPAERLAAALLEEPAAKVLALRLSADEGLGLPVLDADGASPEEAEAALPETVFATLANFTGGRPLQLSLPTTQVDNFRAWLQAHPEADVELVDERWALWIDGAAHVGLDLMPAVGGRSDEGTDWRRWRWPLVLAAALVLFNIAALNGDWWRLRREGTQLQQQMAAIYQRSFPQDPLVGDPLAQMRQKLAAARQATGQLAPGDFLAMSATLGEAWREAGADLRAIAALEYRDGLLTVRLRPGIPLSLDTLQPALAARRLEASAAGGDAAVWQIRSQP